MSEDDIAARDLEERARKLFSGPVTFLKSAPQLKFLPDPEVAEIAFCGRSNVGKSSLLNALTGRKAIARTSVTPGRTQELNFFALLLLFLPLLTSFPLLLLLLLLLLFPSPNFFSSLHLVSLYMLFSMLFLC